MADQRVCKQCGDQFPHEPRRGRPWTICPACRQGGQSAQTTKARKPELVLVETAELEDGDEAPITEARVKELVAEGVQGVQSHSTITLTHIPAFAIAINTSKGR